MAGIAFQGAGGGAGGAAFTQGTFAARPAASANALYFATDTGEWWVANAAGNAWQSIAKTSAGTLTISNLTAGTNNFPGVSVAGGAGGLLGAHSGVVGVDSDDWNIHTAGKGVKVAEGANAKQGTAVLVAGTVTVANTSVTVNSRIFLTSNADGGTPGFLRVSARVAGTSFTITSSNAADTSTVAYEIFEPGV